MIIYEKVLLRKKINQCGNSPKIGYWLWASSPIFPELIINLRVIMYGYIYQVTNLINGRKYIGRHKSSEFDTTYKGSGKVITQALKQYGYDNFSCEILKECTSEEDLNESESYFIEKFNCVDSDEYYNLKPGGIGKSQSGLTYIREISSGKCKKVPHNEIDAFIESGEWIIGGPIPTQESVQKRIASNTGKKRTEEAKKHISDSLKGKPLSEQHKQSLRHTKKGVPWRTGKVQVYKDGDFQFIDESSLNQYLSMGYIRLGKPKTDEHKNNIGNGKRGKIAILNLDTNQKKYIDESEFNKYQRLGFVKLRGLNKQ